MSVFQLYFDPCLLVSIRGLLHGLEWHSVAYCCVSLKRSIDAHALWSRVVRVPHHGCTQNAIWIKFDINQSLGGVSFTSGLRSIHFGDIFNQSLHDVDMPPELRELVFGRDFDQSLERVRLPHKLESLTFGDCFNQALNNVHLPPHLERIKFGKCFNQPVCGVAWPETLQEMRFGDDFNQQVDGDFTLPPALRVLTFGS